MFAGPAKHAVRLAMLAVILELTVSANLLTFIGVPYVTDGGCLLFKLHPGTYLLILSFVLLVTQRAGWSLIVSQKELAGFLGLITSSVMYSFLVTGTGNLIVLFDTFLPAGLLSLVLSRALPSQLRHLRLLMQVLLLANSLLALAETAAHATLIPLYLNDSAYHPHTEDFRPTALFDHPLTGSIMAMLGLALTPKRRWCSLPYSGLMWASLLAYGGRIAVVAALFTVCGCQASRTVDMILRRQPQAGLRILAATTMLIGVSLVTVVAVELGLGTRLAGHLYWDNSAQVRLAQWQLLNHLSGWQFVFGTPREDLLALLVPLRLGTGVEVIENFWLLMFVSFGLLAFPIFLGALWSLFAWCWRQSLLQGRLLLFGVLIVTSTSNSIGRKSTILVCMVATVTCMPTRSCLGKRRSLSHPEIYGLVAA